MIVPLSRFDDVYRLLKQASSATGFGSGTLLVICAADADSLCCLRILTSLLQIDEVSYRIRPVFVKEDLALADQDVSQSPNPVKSVVMINCGGGAPLSETLPSLPEGAVCYVLDSRRPLDADNVADDNRVIILGSPCDDDEARDPAPDTPATPAGGESDAEAESEPEPATKRPKRSRGVWYAESAARTALRLAAACGRERDAASIWWAIVGTTYQYLDRRIDEETFKREVKLFRTEVGVDVVFDEGDPTATRPAITYSNDFSLTLLKHWTLYDSLYHSPNVAAKLGIWRQNGRQQLEVLLAKMGVPLTQGRSAYAAMDVELKQRLPHLLSDWGPRFGLEGLFGPSFSREYGSRARLSSADVVHAVSALLEDSCGGERSACFWSAYNALSGDRRHVDALMRGVEGAVRAQEDVVAQAVAIITSRSITMSGPFRYAIISESALLPRFAHEHALARLAHFLVDALAEMRRNVEKPLIVCALNDARGSYVVVGASPYHLSKKDTNIFALHFDRAARATHSRVTHHGFDAAVVEIQHDDLSKFLEYLHAALTST
eukprot:m51a1_g14622 Cell division control protein 45 (549) ;mRNA; r:1231182-1233586